jgi:hypothetical protein
MQLHFQEARVDRAPRLDFPKCYMMLCQYHSLRSSKDVATKNGRVLDTRSRRWLSEIGYFGVSGLVGVYVTVPNTFNALTVCLIGPALHRGRKTAS